MSKMTSSAVSVCDISVAPSFQSYLKGHSGHVTAMSWSADDSVLVSCADDGSLYEWDISDGGKRLHELVIKSCAYSDLVLTSKCVLRGASADLLGVVLPMVN